MSAKLGPLEFHFMHRIGIAPLPGIMEPERGFHGAVEGIVVLNHSFIRMDPMPFCMTIGELRHWRLCMLHPGESGGALYLMEGVITLEFCSNAPDWEPRIYHDDVHDEDESMGRELRLTMTLAPRECPHIDLTLRVELSRAQREVFIGALRAVINFGDGAKANVARCAHSFRRESE